MVLTVTHAFFLFGPVEWNNAKAQTSNLLFVMATIILVYKKLRFGSNRE